MQQELGSDKPNFVQHAVKDSVFSALFGDKTYLLQAYRALHPEDEGATEEDLNDITIQNVLINGVFNDLGFMVRDRLIILLESQSTWSLNILIRMLIYLAWTYQRNFTDNQDELYGKKKLHLPKPELHVIYAGDPKGIPNEISLADEFFEGDKSVLDLKIKVIKATGSDDILNQYIMFCQVYDEMRREYGRRQEAIAETIHICKDRNILREFLESREKEVETIMMTLFDQEEITKSYGRRCEERGEIKRTVIDARYYGADKESAIARLIDQFNLTRQEAQNSVETYWG